MDRNRPFFWPGFSFGSEESRPENEPAKIQDQSGETEQVKKIGPYVIEGKRIAIIAHIREREGYVLPSSYFEIQDEAGVSHCKQGLGFIPGLSTNIEGAFKLEGKSGEGLIIYFDSGPTAPSAGKSFQIFGLEKGNIKPLSLPITVYGNFEQLPKKKSDQVLKLLDGDLIKAKVWKGLIGVVVPLLVDLKRLTIVPLNNNGIFDIYLGSDPDKPYKLPRSFYRDHNLNAKIEKIDILKGTDVHFLKAFADVRLKQDWAPVLDVDVSNLWLKVKINGQEGWLNDLDDFINLGLSPSG